MKRVLRYRLEINDTVQEIGYGEPIFAQMSQPNKEMGLSPQIDIWIEVHTPRGWPNAEEEKRSVKIFGTGQPMLGNYVHLMSCVVDREIWHIYDMMLEPGVDD